MVSIRKKIGEGVLYSSMGNFVIKIFSALGYFLIVSTFSLHDYGTFIILTSVIGPISAVVFLTCDRIFVSRYAQARERGEWGFIKGLLKEYYTLNLLLLVVLVVSGFLLRDFLTRFYDIYLIQFFWATVLFVIAQFFMNQVSLFLEANEKFREISFMQTGESIVRVLLIVLVSYFAWLSVSAVLFIYIGAKIFAVFIGLFFSLVPFKNLRRNSAISKRGVLREIFFAVGKWEIGKNFVDQFLYPLKLFLIKLFVSIEGVAVFEFARNIYSFASSLLPISKVIFPIISRNVTDKEKISLIVSKAKKYTFLAYVPIYIVIVICTPSVLSRLFPQYVGSEFIIFIALLHFLTEVYKIGQSAFLYAFNRQRFVFFVSPFLVLSQVLVDILFVRSFGIVGIVLSWHISALLGGLVYNIYIHQKIGIKKTSWREFFKFDSYDRLILSDIVDRILRIGFLRKLAKVTFKRE